MRLLKDEVSKLSDAGKLLRDFKKHWIKPLQKNTNKHLPFLKSLSDEIKQDVNYDLRQMKSLFDDLQYLQFVNEKLKSLAHRGVELEVAVFSDDKKRLKHLIRSLLRDNHTSLQSIIRDVNSTSVQIDMLHDLYQKILENLQLELPLEHHVSLLDAKHNKLIKEIIALHAQQKKTASLAGRAIVDKLRHLRRTKKYKKLF